MIKTFDNIQTLNLNPVVLMDIVYGKKTFYLKNNYDIQGKDILLASRYGHAGDGTLPGMAAVLGVVERIDKVNTGLYRYKLKSSDVFEPFETKQNEPIYTLEHVELNMLDSSNNTEWIEDNFYPYIRGAYVNYLGEYIVPDPEYI